MRPGLCLLLLELFCRGGPDGGNENASSQHLTTAVSNGKFLDTLVSVVANETDATTSGRRLDALDGVSVDVNATLEEVAEAEVAFFISTPVPTSVPSPVPTCVEINQCVGCTRQFFTKSPRGDGAAVLARSSGEEPASPRHRAGVASMAWRTTRRFSTNAP